jgi:hypothetical protein
MPILAGGETLSASVDVRASAEAVYGVVSDVTRIPEWSPETGRVKMLSPSRFRAWNRRRLGRWSTVADIVIAEPGQRISFVVQAFGGDWTQWTYQIDAGPTATTSRLTEEFRMCVNLPLAAVVFERLCLWVWDRRVDLQKNLDTSVERICEIVERET